MVILLALVIGHLIFYFVLGDPANFDAEGHPKAGSFLGVMYKGGFIVPILLALLITVVTIGVERFITIQRAKGKGSIELFVRKIKGYLASGHIDEAINECDRQQGSLANVMRCGVVRYKEVHHNKEYDFNAKEAAIMKELEEATALELPMCSLQLSVNVTKFHSSSM